MLDDLHEAADVDRLEIVILRGDAGEEAGEHLGPVDTVIAGVDEPDLPVEIVNMIIVLIYIDYASLGIPHRLVRHSAELAAHALAPSAVKNLDHILLPFDYFL